MPACPKCGFNPSSIVTASWSFTIDRAVRSLNAASTNRGAWRTRKAYKDDRDAWCWHMRAKRLELKIPTTTRRRRVTLIRLYTGRAKEFDHENLVGGCKAPTDAMVSERLLLDDKPQYVELHHRQERSNRNALVVLIEEVVT